MMSYNCWYKLDKPYNGVSYGILTAFQHSAGFPVVTNACGGEYIRSVSLWNFYSLNFKALLDGRAGGKDYTVCNQDPSTDCGGTAAGPDHIIAGGFGGNTGPYLAHSALKQGICYGCYSRFLDDIQADLMNGTLGNLGIGSGLYSTCRSNPESSLCMMSVFVATNLDRFKTCTSGYSIDFTGPLCYPEQLAAVTTTMNPLPYTFLTRCAAQNCTDIQKWNYFVNLKNVTNSHDCTSCYNDAFYDLKEAFSTNTSLPIACAGRELYSQNCRSGLSHVLEKFTECGGGNLTAISETIVPSLSDEQGNTTTTTTYNNSNITTTSRSASTLFLNYLLVTIPVWIYKL